MVSRARKVCATADSEHMCDICVGRSKERVYSVFIVFIYFLWDNNDDIIVVIGSMGAKDLYERNHIIYDILLQRPFADAEQFWRQRLI